MTIFQFALNAHILAGTVVLAAFWTAALAAKISNEGLREQVTALLPDIERAVQSRRATVALEAEIGALGGKLICAPSGPPPAGPAALSVPRPRRRGDARPGPGAATAPATGA